MVAETNIEQEFLVGRVRKIEVLIADLTSLNVRVLVSVGLRKPSPQMIIDVTCVREMDPKKDSHSRGNGVTGWILCVYFVTILNNYTLYKMSM